MEHNDEANVEPFQKGLQRGSKGASKESNHVRMRNPIAALNAAVCRLSSVISSLEIKKTSGGEGRNFKNGKRTGGCLGEKVISRVYTYEHMQGQPSDRWGVMVRETDGGEDHQTRGACCEKMPGDTSRRRDLAQPSQTVQGKGEEGDRTQGGGGDS